jgi:hypothetical protein
MKHVRLFDTGTFQVYIEDDALPVKDRNIYFMFGEEYSFSLEDFVALARFLCHVGVLDDIQAYSSHPAAVG